MRLCVHAYAAGAVVTVVFAGSVYAAYKLYQNLRKARLPTEWKFVGNLSNIYIYPIKSCAAVEIDNAECSTLGLRHDDWLRDRVLMVTDVKYNFITGRQYPDLVTVYPSVKNSILTLKHRDMEPLSLNLAEVVSNTKPKIAEIWNVQVPVYDCGWEVSEWFSRLLNKSACSFRLVYYASKKSRKMFPGCDFHKVYKFTKNDMGAFPDDVSYNLINEASVQDLNTRVKDAQVSHRSFRPNLVLKGATPYEEDNWKFVKIGDNVFEIIKPCTRCSFTTVDSESGIRSSDNEPLATLKSYRQVEDPELRKVEGESPRMGLQMALRSKPGGFVAPNDAIYAA